MASLYLATATHHAGEWLDYPRARIVESYRQDTYCTHRLVDEVDAADVILFSTNHIYPPLGLGILGERIFKKHRARCIRYDSSDYPSPIFGGLCASWPRGEESIVGLAIGWCYHHPSAAEAELNRLPWKENMPYLWSFCGSKKTHAVRDRLMRINDPEAFLEDTSSRSQSNLMSLTTSAEQMHFLRHYVEILSDSAFILCPRGVGPSSMRIFEAMRAGRVPVIVSDDWLPPPFVSWDACSLRILEKDVERIPDILRERRGEARSLAVRAYEEWARVFGPAGLFHHTMEACLELIRKRPANFNLQQFKRTKLLLTPHWRSFLCGI